MKCKATLNDRLHLRRDRDLIIRNVNEGVQMALRHRHNSQLTAHERFAIAVAANVPFGWDQKQMTWVTESCVIMFVGETLQVVSDDIVKCWDLSGV